MTRPNYALAASVAALIVAAPLAFHTYRETTNFKPLDATPQSAPLARAVTEQPRAAVLAESQVAKAQAQAQAEQQRAAAKRAVDKTRADQQARIAQDSAPRRATTAPAEAPAPAAKMAAAPPVAAPAHESATTAADRARAAATEAVSAAQPATPSAWVKLCEPTGITTLCLTQHERIDGNTGTVLIAAALHNDAATAGETFLVRVPLVLSTGTTMTISIDATLPELTLKQISCDAAGCLFGIPVDPIVKQRMESATLLLASVMHNQKAVSFPIPMSGFSVALAGPPRDNKTYTQTRSQILRSVAEQQTALFAEFKKQAASSHSTAATGAAAEKRMAQLEDAQQHASAKAASDSKAKAEQRRAADAGAGQLLAGIDKAPAQSEPSAAVTTARKGNRTNPETAATAPPPAAAPSSQGLIAMAPKANVKPSGLGLGGTASPTVQGLDNAGVRRRHGFLAPEPGDTPTTRPPTTDTRERIADVTRLEQERDSLQRAQAQGRVLGEQIASLDREIAAKRAELMQPPAVTESRDRFESLDAYPIKRVTEEPVSTFSMDVDTASYSFVRRTLNAGRLPPKDAVRVEEMINYFPYDYPRPESASAPFLPTITVVPSPWNSANKLVHIAIKGYAIDAAQRPRANLVFLVDVSGSMGPADRLPLLRNAFRMLVDQLKPDDTVSIVTYANNTRVALEPTKAADKSRIISVIDSLQAGGGTYGEGGLQKAYSLAEANFDKTGVNRIILATDGDFNIGISDRNQLKSFIEKKRDTGIFFSVLGVGQGNHNDALMQTLARNGNGVAAYIDTLAEARKVLVDEASSTLFPIAKDAKIQVEFNPAQVSEYRLIGYEKRALRREDFNNDKVDAAEIGSGLSVTAIYEITPAGAVTATDPLRYAQPDTTRREPAATGSADSELGFLKLRYKLPKEDASKLLTIPIAANAERPLAKVTNDVRFSIAVAGFGQLLKGAQHTKSFGFDDVAALASSGRGDDPFGYRAEFISLARIAKLARP